MTEGIENAEGHFAAVAITASHSERLETLEVEHPKLNWIETDKMSTEELLYQVWQRGIDCTVADSNVVDINRRYLSELKKHRFADEVKEPDPTWLALAAYNIGRAHLHDAQTLARELELSPYHWNDIKQVLPLLTEKRYYKNLKYGYARGTEPVRYVQRIREYRHMLENKLNQ